MNYDLVDLLLKSRHMSRRQLAIKCGITPGTMSTWFARRTKNIPLQHIQSIAKELQVSWFEVAGVYPVDDGQYMEIATDGKSRVFDAEGNCLWTATDFRHSIKIETESEGMLIHTYRLLNDIGQKLSLRHTYLLADMPEFQNKTSAGIHEPSDYRKDSATTKETDQDQK